MRRGVEGRLARHVSEQLAFGRTTVIGVPHFDGSALVGELGEAKVRASEMTPLTAGDVAAVRKRLGMTQEQFAEWFALDVATVRNWEQGRSSVDGAAAVLIKAIARAPDVVHAAASDATTVLNAAPLEGVEPA
jgi:putative transcriptional regulator